jgi:uncharacterized protein YdeI (YjbR/CyaY-like superfamily)
MAKSLPNKRVDVFLKKEARWPKEVAFLRDIALSTGLTEDLKWGQPCYTLENRNIFLIHGFKDYFAVLFMKGAVMKDPKKILIQQTANVQAARQLRFASLKEATAAKATIKAYMNEAIAVEESGDDVPVKKAAEFVIPTEVTAGLKKVPGLTVAFKKLTPGRQRAYCLHFMGTKVEATRASRIAKAAPKILAGKGLND